MQDPVHVGLLCWTVIQREPRSSWGLVGLPPGCQFRGKKSASQTFVTISSRVGSLHFVVFCVLGRVFSLSCSVLLATLRGVLPTEGTRVPEQLLRAGASRALDIRRDVAGALRGGRCTGRAPVAEGPRTPAHESRRLPRLLRSLPLPWHSQG